MTETENHNANNHEEDDVKAQKKEQLKANVQHLLPADSHVAQWCNAETLEKFLMARDWDVAQSTKMLSTAIAWRLEKKPEEIVCPYCPKNPRAHCMRIVGVDHERRPVIYACFAQANDRWAVEPSMEHLLELMEHAGELMKKVGSSHWVWIVDFHGFGISDCNVHMITHTIHLLDYYPSRLGQFIALDAPWLFSGLFKTVWPLLPAATKAKVFFSTIKEMDSKITPVLGEAMTSWLKREVADNRARNQEKKFWEYLDEHGNPKEHDSRGERSYVQGPHYRLPIPDAYFESQGQQVNGASVEETAKEGEETSNGAAGSENHGGDVE